MGRPPKKDEAKADDDGKPWMVFRWCACPSCRDIDPVPNRPCDDRGGYFFGPGAKEKEGLRPYWMKRS